MITNLAEYKEYIRNKKIAVIGFGISNQALVRFLNKCGAHNISIFDKSTADTFISSCEKLVSAGTICDYFYGDKYLSTLTGGKYDIIFRSPIVRYDTPEVAACVAEGSVLTSEIETVLMLAPCKTYGVTGSDGKTTTTTLISKFLEAHYAGSDTRIWLGGNIGRPLIDVIDEIKPSDRIVLELSSFQLMDMKISTDVAVITNLSPNHLDVHKSYEEYAFAKKSIFAYQKENGRLVLNALDEMSVKLLGDRRTNVSYFSARTNKVPGFSSGSSLLSDDGSYLVYKDASKRLTLSRDTINVLGLFNVENFLAAMCAVKDEVDDSDLEKVAAAFHGVEHRLEYVRTVSGVKFYNSSIDSSPKRTISTLSVFTQKIIMIAGGKDKGISYEEIGPVLCEKVKVLVLVGPTSQAIEESVNNADPNHKITIIRQHNYRDAVDCAYSHAQSGDIVLLSPASTSFDLFRNFEERGKKYKEIVNLLNLK
ncbi:MAG: UDP-N-acetylmuramoyl-L-alanine--D-glutamate ligase [Ruminococcaceae bacterium]|nr:UDP-N-acetylmuramoyl-L-alanine--D-glutamate ligase [Oscillospiraceae bacterium]